MCLGIVTKAFSFAIFDNKLLRWSTFCSPFLLITAISMLNIARNIHFNNKIVNYISSLSLLIYIIHENQLLRTFYRPLMWNYVYNQFGYVDILFCMFIFKYRRSDLLLMVLMPLLGVLNVYLWVLLFRSGFSFFILRST